MYHIDPLLWIDGKMELRAKINEGDPRYNNDYPLSFCGLL